ncbi:MAG: hypothetical protein AAF416_15830 [Pseudomonadota bacterium]
MRPSGKAAGRAAGGLLLLAALVSGCSFSGTISEHALAYNDTIERAENGMLLRNIVRISQHYPVHFTRVSEVAGALTVSADASAEGAIGRDAERLLDLGLDLGGSSKPSYKVQVLNTQEFYNGLLRPIDAGTYGLLFDAGWPADLLFFVLVEEAKIYLEPGVPGAGEVVCRMIGDLDSGFLPRDRAGRTGFLAQEQLAYLAQALSRTRVVDVRVENGFIGAPFPVASVGDAGALVKVADGPFAIQSEPGNAGMVRLVRRRSTTRFLSPAAASDRRFFTRADTALTNRPSGRCGEEIAAMETLRDADADRVQVAADLTLRSAHGVFYALGEMLALTQALSGQSESRISRDNRTEAEVRNRLASLIRQDNAPPFFAMQQVDIADPGTLATQFRGRSYVIPEGMAGQTSRRLLSLAHLLFSMNVSAKDAPSTQTIRVLN